MGRIPVRVFLASALLASVCVAAAQDPPGEQATALARKAARAEKDGKSAEAYILYSEAAALQPKSSKYRGKMASLQTRAALEGKSAPPPSAASAPTAPDSDPELSPDQVFDSLTARELSAARPLLQPPTLKATPGRKDFDLHGNARSLYDQIAKAFGLETIYDGDFPPTGPAIAFHVDQVDYREALHDMEAATGSFVIPISPTAFMVAQDNPAKRNDLEQYMTVSIRVPQVVTVQELTEIVQAVRQTTNVEKIAWNTADAMIVIRDRVSRVIPAQALLLQLLNWRPEVMVEVEFIEVADSDLMNYGFNVTNTFPAVYLGSVYNSVVNIPSGVTNLVTFGGGKTLIGLGVATAEALFNETFSSAKTLFRAEIRAADGAAATFHAGEKYPVVTSTFTGSAGGTTSALQTAPAYTFEDLGVSLKVTPRIHDDGEVTMSVETSFEVLTGSSVNDIPVIGRRSLNNQVRLRDGEWAIVAGMMNSTESKSVTGFWGLAQLPLVGSLFRQTSTDKEHDNILIAIRPHTLSLPPDQGETRALRVGTETRPFNPL